MLHYLNVNVDPASMASQPESEGVDLAELMDPLGLDQGRTRVSSLDSPKYIDNAHAKRAMCSGCRQST